LKSETSLAGVRQSLEGGAGTKSSTPLVMKTRHKASATAVDLARFAWLEAKVAETLSKVMRAEDPALADRCDELLRVCELPRLGDPEMSVAAQMFAARGWVGCTPGEKAQSIPDPYSQRLLQEELREPRCMDFKWDARRFKGNDHPCSPTNMKSNESWPETTSKINGEMNITCPLRNPCGGHVRHTTTVALPMCSACG
jgi:hypothetical protein